MRTRLLRAKVAILSGKGDERRSLWSIPNTITGVNRTELNHRPSARSCEKSQGRGGNNGRRWGMGDERRGEGD